MAHFFLDSPSGTGVNVSKAVNFVHVKPGSTVEVGIWGARVNGQFLLPSTNNGSVATVEGSGVKSSDGMIRHLKIRALREGNVMLEARAGVGGPVWAATQIVARAAAQAAPAASGTTAIAQLAVTVAREELRRGVFESNNDNRGERIDEYQRLFNLSGQSWCLMFVYWCFHQAASRLGAKNPLPRTAAVSALVTWANRESRIVSTPAAGDILVVKPSRHAGLVVGGQVASGRVPTIEGNTWARSSYESRKEGVYELTKHRLEDCLYVRP